MSTTRFSVGGDRAHVEFVRRGGRWVVKLRHDHLDWKLAAEWAGITLLCCLMIVLGALTGYCWGKTRFDDQSRAFATETLRAVTAGWSEEALLARASPQMVASASDGLANYFTGLRRLGPGAAVQDCAGGSAFKPLAFKNLVQANYICRVRLKGGEAIADISLRRDPDDWKITRFYLAPPRP